MMVFGFFAQGFMPRTLHSDHQVESAKLLFHITLNNPKVRELEQAEEIDGLDLRLPVFRAKFLQSGYFTRQGLLQSPLDDNEYLEPLTDCYRRCSELAPANGSFPYLIGWIYETRATLISVTSDKLDSKERKQYRQAAVELIKNKVLPNYQKAIDLYPANPRYHYALGKAYDAIGDTKKRDDEYARALDLSKRQWVERLKLSPEIISTIKKSRVQ